MNAHIILLYYIKYYCLHFNLTVTRVPLLIVTPFYQSQSLSVLVDKVKTFENHVSNSESLMIQAYTSL